MTLTDTSTITITGIYIPVIGDSDSTPDGSAKRQPSGPKELPAPMPGDECKTQGISLKVGALQGPVEGKQSV